VQEGGGKFFIYEGVETVYSAYRERERDFSFLEHNQKGREVRREGTIGQGGGVNWGLVKPKGGKEEFSANSPKGEGPGAISTEMKKTKRQMGKKRGGEDARLFSQSKEIFVSETDERATGI